MDVLVSVGGVMGQSESPGRQAVCEVMRWVAWGESSTAASDESG